MNYMVIFDLIILGLGIYLLYTSVQMKKKGEISTLIVNSEEIPKCRDKQGFIDFMYKKTLILAIVALVFGILAGISDGIHSFGKYFTIGADVIFVVTWLWFIVEQRKGREKYFL